MAGRGGYLLAACQALIIGVCLAGTAEAEPAQQPVYEIDVPAQIVPEALNSLSEQTGVPVIYPYDLAGDRDANPVNGRYTLSRALSVMLKGTGLSGGLSKKGVLTITRNGSAARNYEERTVSQADQRQPSDSGSSFLASIVALLATAVGSPQAAGQDSEGAEQGQLEEIVVHGRYRARTATKVETALIDTPQAISVITADQFADRGAVLYEETLRYSASMNPESFGTDPRLSNAVVRGFGATNYLDGLRYDFGFANLARLDVYTLDRVEVFRGPSSVLYGAGGAGGLVNHTRKRPQFDSAFEVGAQFGSYDRRQLQIDLTGPLNDSGTLAGRLIGVERDSNTQVDFVSDDRTLLMPAVTWRPGDDTNVTVMGTWTRDRLGLLPQFHPLSVSLQAPSPSRRLPDSFFGGEPDFDRFDVDEKSATLHVDHRFSDTLSFSSSSRYLESQNEIDVIFVNAFTPDPFIDPDSEVINRFATREEQEIDVVVTDNRLLWDVTTGTLTHTILAGIDYQRFAQSGRLGFGAATDLNVFDPVYGNVPDIEKFPVPEQELTQLGVYLQDQIDYGDRLHLLLGIRRDRATSQTEGDPEQIDEEVTFRAAVNVDLWSKVSSYVSYAESFLPVAGFSTFEQDPFEPQKGTMFEIGVKWQPNPVSLITAATFDIKEKNRFTNHPTDPTLLVQQGEVSSKGFELEASGILLDDTLEVAASYSYVDAKISESNDPVEIGRQLDVVPKHQSSLWVVKSFEAGGGTRIRTGAGVRYMGSHLSSGTLEIPSYTLVDALIAVHWEQWALSVNATNLLDERHYSTCLARGDCFAGARRNVIGTVMYRF